MDFVIGLGAFLGVLSGSLLLFFKASRKSVNVLLAASMFCLSYLSVISHFNGSGLILEFPHLTRTALIPAYLVFPLLYLYYKGAIAGDSSWKSWYWLFAIPAVIYIIDFSGFFLLSAEDKIRIFSGKVGDTDEIFRFNEGILGLAGFHLILRTIWGSIFLVMIGKLLWVYRSEFMNGSVKEKSFFYVQSFIWSIFCLLLLIPAVLNLVLKLEIYTVAFLSHSLAYVVIFVSLCLLFYPQLLYGYYWTYQAETKKLTLPSSGEKASDESLQSRMAGEIKIQEEALYIQLEEHVKEHSVYQEIGYTIHMLSKEIGIPAYKISAVINSAKGTNFNNWLNDFRVDYFIRLIEEGEAETYTIQSLAKKCGFSSRTSFTSAFKKKKGTTPGQYLRQSTQKVS